MKRISRFASDRPEDIAWRVEQAEVDGTIEGIETSPELEELVTAMDAEGLSPEEQIERIIAFAKARSAQAATDRSPEAVETRRRAIEQATASNRRAGYVHDPVLEVANKRYIAGDITIDEHRAEMVARYTKEN